MTKSGAETRDIVLVAACLVVQEGATIFSASSLSKIIAKFGTNISVPWIQLALEFHAGEAIFERNNDSYGLTQDGIDYVDQLLARRKAGSYEDLLKSLL